MASVVNKLLRRSPSLISRAFHQSPLPASPSPSPVRSLLRPLLQNPGFLNLDPPIDSRPAGNPSSPLKTAAFTVFPGFPYCLVSSPVADSSFSVGCDEDSEESDGDGALRVDSVKKKRKKKMNKHKYRKLRKSLRRQT